MTSNIEEAWRYLRMHQKWHRMGMVGRMVGMDKETEEWRRFRREKESFPDWCVRMALSTLGDPLSRIVCVECGWDSWDVDEARVTQEAQPDGSTKPVGFLICPICKTPAEI